MHFGKMIPNVSLPTLPRTAIESAVLRLLRPLVRLLLRHGVPFAAFEAMAKRVYIEAAQQDFVLPGRKQTVSRVSILSGLTRKEVKRVLAERAGESPDRGKEPAARLNRAVRVLGGWARDAEFSGTDGAPCALALEGDRSFAALVRRHSGDMPARAVLDELLRVGAVRQRTDGQVEIVQAAYVPQDSAVDKLHMLGTDAADLIATIEHNLEHGADDPRFQRKVMYDHLDPARLPAFRALGAQHAQSLLEQLDHWLAAHAPDPSAPPAAHARAGLGIYYFEEIRSSSSFPVTGVEP